MTEQERDLLRQEAEYRVLINDDVFGKISQTVIELLDALDERDREVERLKRENKMYRETSVIRVKEFERLRKALEEIATDDCQTWPAAMYIEVARQALAGEEIKRGKIIYIRDGESE